MRVVFQETFFVLRTLSQALMCDKYDGEAYALQAMLSSCSLHSLVSTSEIQFHRDQVLYYRLELEYNLHRH